MTETTFDTFIMLHGIEGEVSGMILKSEIIAVNSATDDEAILEFHLRNGSVLKHFTGYEYNSSDDPLLMVLSNLGWT